MTDVNDFLNNVGGENDTSPKNILESNKEILPAGVYTRGWQKGLAKVPTTHHDLIERRKRQKKTAREMFHSLEPRAIRAIGWLCAYSKSEDMRFKAACYLLDRSLGKIPDPPKVFVGPDGGPIQLQQSNQTSLSVLFGLDSLAKTPPPPVIEGQKDNQDD